MSQEKLMEVKVIFVETTVVETDAVNFMSVVQNLTGNEQPKANKKVSKQTTAPVEAYKSPPSLPALLNTEALDIANGGFEIEENVVDEVDAWMELEPHLHDLYELMNQ
jgi:VQ motif